MRCGCRPGAAGGCSGGGGGGGIGTSVSSGAAGVIAGSVFAVLLAGCVAAVVVVLYRRHRNRVVDASDGFKSPWSPALTARDVITVMRRDKLQAWITQFVIGAVKQTGWGSFAQRRAPG